jgi:hypothetical protein
MSCHAPQVFRNGDRVIVSERAGAGRGRSPWLGVVYRVSKPSPRGRTTRYDVCTPNLYRNGTCDYDHAVTSSEPHIIATVDAKHLTDASSMGL